MTSDDGMIYPQFQLGSSKDSLTSNSAKMVATGNFACNRCKAWKNSGTCTSTHGFLYLFFSHLLSGRLVIGTGKSQCRNIPSCRIPLFISPFYFVVRLGHTARSQTSSTPSPTSDCAHSPSALSMPFPSSPLITGDR